MVGAAARRGPGAAVVHGVDGSFCSGARGREREAVRRHIALRVHERRDGVEKVPHHAPSGLRARDAAVSPRPACDSPGALKG